MFVGKCVYRNSKLSAYLIVNTVLKYTKSIHRFNYCSYLIYLCSCRSLNLKNALGPLRSTKSKLKSIVKPTEIFFRCTCNKKVLSI